MGSEYWESRYRAATIGWDIGEISMPLKTYIDQLDDKNFKILIPGGGNSYEAEYLFSKGFQNVFVNDFAEQPLLNLKERVPEFPNSNLLFIDFFDITQQFDFIIEQTFFCSLPPLQREAYMMKMYDLLLPNGRLSGLLYNTCFETEGPPYGGDQEEYFNLFQRKFHIKVLEPCYNSISPREKNELFFIFIKK